MASLQQDHLNIEDKCASCVGLEAMQRFQRCYITA